MKKHLLIWMAMTIVPFSAFAVDGTVLINQSTVMAGGGFPYVISQPGSYKLSSNLVAPSGVNAINIGASNVTLDLNGFNISNLGLSSIFQSYAVTGSPGTSVSNIVIRNGTLTNWEAAIQFFSNTSLITVEDLSVQADFTVGGTTVSNAVAVLLPAHSFVKRVVTEGQVQVDCPSIVSETIGRIFTFGAGCVLSTTTAP